jgi:hypothetical protein
MSKKFKLAIAVPFLAIAAIAAANYFLLQRSIEAVLSSDNRNEGISVFAHYEFLVAPSTLVIDLRKISATNSPANVTRVLLQFAKTQKERKFTQVKLSHQGTQKFILKGDYFQTLGMEFGEQNPVYTMRTFSENVFKLDGTAAFGTWTGGLLGVVGKQMEDFNDFHKQWYITDLLKSRS